MTFARLAVRLLLWSFVFTTWAQEPYDIVLLGGKIVDGTGNAWFYGDLGIRGDRIARITPAGLLDSVPARLRVNVRGLVVAPGFIDIQSHSRGAFLFGDGRVLSKITQGITTEIMGEGFTDAPVNDRMVSFYGPVTANESKIIGGFKGDRGFDAWLKAMHERGTSPNIGSFVGANNIRMYVKGMEPGAATINELEQMRTLVRRSMEDGAFGIASALIYPPGIYADTEELVELAKAMAAYGGVYITHMRSEADRFIEALDEAIDIGRRGGVPVEIYHLKAAGVHNWDKARLAIEKINGAREAGLDIGADMYAYVAGSTSLEACLPPSSAAGGKLLERLKDPNQRAIIRAEALKDGADWEQMCKLATPENVLIVGVAEPGNNKWLGKRLSEIAAEQRKHYIDAAIDLIVSERGGPGTVFFLMSEDNIRLQLQQAWIKFGTDAAGLDPAKSTGLDHPRSYGNFPRVLGKYVREERVIPLEDAIRKMTSAVAARLSIHDRGVLKPGMYADLVAFDPATITDRATFEKPHQLSIGMSHVVVNGSFVLRDGAHTGAFPGRIVRGPGYQPRSTP